MRKPKKRISLIVSMDLPPGATAYDIRDYVRDAVTTWWGQLEPPGGSTPDSPGDPLWRLTDHNITIKYLKIRSKPHDQR